MKRVPIVKQENQVHKEQHDAKTVKQESLLPQKHHQIALRATHRQHCTKTIKEKWIAKHVNRVKCQ
jgi:hypothetical protein